MRILLQELRWVLSVYVFTLLSFIFSFLFCVKFLFIFIAAEEGMKNCFRSTFEGYTTNYFLRHNIQTGSWADAMLNSELISLLGSHLYTELGSMLDSGSTA